MSLLLYILVLWHDADPVVVPDGPRPRGSDRSSRKTKISTSTTRTTVPNGDGSESIPTAQNSVVVR